MERSAVILLGGRDFGRCPIATERPRALWPLVEKPVLEYQVAHLRRQGVTHVVICAGADTPVPREEIAANCDGVSFEFVTDRMPRGSAGCIKDAVRNIEDTSVLVIEGGVFWIPGSRDVIDLHRASGTQLTLLALKRGGDTSQAQSAGVYVCEPSVLEAVPDDGYWDLKEQFIPDLLRSGAEVKAMPVDGEIITGRGVESYLALMDRALSSPERFGLDLSGFTKREAGIWVAAGVDIATEARLSGPVVILEGASVANEAVVTGPAIIGRGCRIEARAIVDASVLWDLAVVGRGACVAECLVGDGAIVKAGETVVRRSVGRKGRRGAVAGDRRKAPETIKTTLAPARRQAPAGVAGVWGLVKVAMVMAAFTWSYWSVLKDLCNVWWNNANYSSGVLVPFLAGYVVFTRRRELAEVPVRRCHWGLLLVIAGFAMRFAGTMLFYASAERLSMMFVISGLVVWFLGLRMTRRLVWVLAFMLLMLPWPNRVYYAVSLPLQKWATASAVFFLEVLGWFVTQEGNILHVGESATVAVTEACSGLRMLTAFMIVSSLMALMCKRPLWQKAIVVVSSVPIAVLCNTIRLTATSIAYTRGYGDHFNKLFHDSGGIAMMPVALVLLTVLLWVLKHVFVPVEPEAPQESAQGRPQV